MNHLDAFLKQTDLIKKLGVGNAHLVWSMGLYLDEPDLSELASECLTDGSDDKKIDFLRLDRDQKRLVFAQGYFTSKTSDSAPANKASDLNTAAAWLVSGDLKNIPEETRTIIDDCRQALLNEEVDSIELLYVHNLPESVNVARELQTAAEHLRKIVNKADLVVTATELGIQQLEKLYASTTSEIDLKEEFVFPSKIEFIQQGPTWRAAVTTVPGLWLNQLFKAHGEHLFSANYRGFLGITKRRKINTAIRQTAETQASDFWVFNNGITILTLKLSNESTASPKLSGLSVINGAQTTGSIGSVDIIKHDLKGVAVLCRVIECSDPETIQLIVKYNNTQNEITTWDQYSNSAEQRRIATEFKSFGHNYSLKRGFQESSAELGIEQVAQPLLAFQGQYRDANQGRNRIFERKATYKQAFEEEKARHILLAYALARSIDERRTELKNKHSAGTLIKFEDPQLRLLRNLKFKYFLVALIAKNLEVILQKKVDLKTVAFSPDASNSSKHTVLQLIAAWSPVVNAVVSYASTILTLDQFQEKYLEEGYLEDVSAKVGALIYANQSHMSFPTLISLVSGS